MGSQEDIAERPIAVIVEDEFIIRELAASVFEDLNYDIVGFATADEALGFIHQNHQSIRWIYTDVRMPGRIDGEALARQVGDAYPALRIIISSGHARLREEDLGQGMAFVAKPWFPVDLKKAVARLSSL